MSFEHLATPDDSDIFLATLASVAPGTELRDGLTRILNGATGALIVLGWNEMVEHISGGGFRIDIAYTPTRLRELAKMDGAIILSSDGSRILSAGVHLLPDGSLPTEETGTRHRTADRVSQQVGFAVVSVSKSTSTVALYQAGHRHVLEDSASILSRANQALSTLERYKMRLDEVSLLLSELEVEDMVTVRDVAVVAQRVEMVRRIAAEIADYALELGSDGRLLSLQYAELVAGVEEERYLVVRDNAPVSEGLVTVESALASLNALTASDLLDLHTVARALGFIGEYDRLDEPITPRGYRLLARVPRLPEFVNDRLVDHFGNVQQLMAATTEQLQDVDGIGETRARSIREGLSRMIEANFR